MAAWYVALMPKEESRYADEGSTRRRAVGAWPDIKGELAESRGYQGYRSISPKQQHLSYLALVIVSIKASTSPHYRQVALEVLGGGGPRAS